MYGEVIVIGIIVSLVICEMTEISPAGLITAGYLAINVKYPMKIAITLLIAVISLGIYKLVEKHTILYGKRRFTVIVLISVFVAWAMNLIPVQVLNVGGIGYIIPGLIAKEFDRQGILITILATAVAAAVTIIIAVSLGAKII